MKFRAGFRRVDVPTPTEYNLQYTWKTPANPDHTPILQAENLLNSQTGPSNYYATNQQHQAQNGHHHVNRDFGEGNEDFQDFDQLELHEEDPLHSNAVDGIADSSQLSGQKAPPIKVPKLQLAASDDKNSQNTGKKSKRAHCLTIKDAKKKPKSHHHHHHRHHHASHHQHASKKHHKGGGGGGWHSKAFVSEYKRQFKAWPVSSTTDTSGTRGVGHSGKKKEKNKKGKHRP